MKFSIVVLFSAFCINATAGLNTNTQTGGCDSEQLNGRWQGKFTQKTGDVEFSIDLHTDGNQITGHSIEKDSRPDQLGNLEAEWVGNVTKDTISLTKHYQLKGASPITYTANCNDNYQSIQGVWKVNLFAKGEFAITKVQNTAQQTQNLNKPEQTNTATIAPEMPVSQISMIDAHPTLNKAIRYSPKPPTDYQSENTAVENANTAPVEKTAIAAEVKTKNTSLPPMPKKLKGFTPPTSQTHSISF